MKRFFTLFLIVMAGQYVLCVHAFSFNAVCLQHNFTQKEVSDTVQTNKNEKPVKLSGVTIEATRVIQKPDGQLIFPSKTQRNSSTNGYSLLAKLSLPRISRSSIFLCSIFSNTSYFDSFLKNIIKSIVNSYQFLLQCLHTFLTGSGKI